MPAFPAFVAANFQGDVTLDHVIPASEARFAPLPSDLRPELEPGSCCPRESSVSTPTRPTLTTRCAAAATWWW